MDRYRLRYSILMNNIFDTEFDFMPIFSLTNTYIGHPPINISSKLIS